MKKKLKYKVRKYTNKEVGEFFELDRKGTEILIKKGFLSRSQQRTQ